MSLPSTQRLVCEECRVFQRLPGSAGPLALVGRGCGVPGGSTARWCASRWKQMFSKPPLLCPAMRLVVSEEEQRGSFQTFSKGFQTLGGFAMN